MVLKLIKLRFLAPVIIFLIGVAYNKELKYVYELLAKTSSNNLRIDLFSESKLSLYNGITEPKLYLAVLGIVFDVTQGKRHYAKGKSYHYFVGKDGSRALITGNFQDEGDSKDHVLDLRCNDLFALLNWQKTFREKYHEIGKLIGRYYDEEGKETLYTKEFQQKIKECEIEKKKLSMEDERFPPCNLSWSADEGTKVWCTKSSGGIIRNWVGVPHELFTPGMKKPRCVCINLEDQSLSPGNIKKYDNCDQSSCHIT